MRFYTITIIVLCLGFSLSGYQALADTGNDQTHAQATSETTHAAPHWSYAGHDGPENWGALDTEFATCASGSQQSPIDLKDARAVVPSPIEIKWKSFTPHVVNNGHTIRINTGEKGAMVLDDKSYTLLQFHFHYKSEHTINGLHYPLEAHFVHKANDGTLGVIGIFFKEGANNPTLQKIWDMAPLEKGEIMGKKKIKPKTLLPRQRAYYRYAGSLTTPPCSEIVSWAVFAVPLEASKAQIEAFAGLFDHNNRPIQPANRRFILYNQ